MVRSLFRWLLELLVVWFAERTVNLTTETIGFIILWLATIEAFSFDTIRARLARRYHRLTRKGRMVSWILVPLIGAALSSIYWITVTHAAKRLREPAPAAIPQAPSAEDIAEAIAKRVEPPLEEKARRHRFRQDLTQYLTWLRLERDTFRQHLLPTVDETGRRIDPTEQLNQSSLRIQEWDTEVTFYIVFRLGNDRGLWFGNKTPAGTYPGGLRDSHPWAFTWDKVTSDITKLEELLREYPEIRGSADAAREIEAKWLPSSGVIAWEQVPTASERYKHAIRLSLRPLRSLEQPIIEVDLTAPIAGHPTEERGEKAVIVGNKRNADPTTYHFEVFGTWTPERPVTLILESNEPLRATDVRYRLW